VTAVERVSSYNSGLFFWPTDPDTLGFQALIDGHSHPFRMNRDGTGKQDLTEGARAFAYGFSSSPDGRQIAYHQEYRLVVAGAEGENPRRIETGHLFNFLPQWSPDGSWILFLCGAHDDCHPFVVRPDGTELRKIGDRHGYRGVVAFLDVDDFHGGSSDVPVWSPNGAWIYYTARVGQSVELMRVSLAGCVERLTDSPPGVLNYHPQLSFDGSRVAFGSHRDGTRELYMMAAEGGEAHRITDVGAGSGAMWPHWRPTARNGGPAATPG
jgi:Tol biopolymer transport system component